MNFLENLKAGRNPLKPKGIKDNIFNSINIKAYIKAAVFTFGKGYLTPQTFTSSLNEWNKQPPEKISLFKYYLERHIEVVGNHFHVAYQMLISLYGNDTGKWSEPTRYVKQALQGNIPLWSGANAKPFPNLNVAQNF